MARTPKQIALDICKGDTAAKRELEKMFGVKLEEMSDAQKKIGLAALAAFDGIWNKK